MTQDNKTKHEVLEKLESIRNSYEENFSFVGNTEENLLELLIDSPTIVFEGLLKFLIYDIQTIDFVFRALFMYQEAYTTPFFFPNGIEELNVLMKYLLGNPGLENLTSNQVEFLHTIMRFNHLDIGDEKVFSAVENKLKKNKEMTSLINNPEPNIEFLKQIVNVRVEG